MVATYAWLSGGELPSQRLRSYTFGLAAAVAFFAAWLTTFTAPCKLLDTHSKAHTKASIRVQKLILDPIDFINPDSLNWGPRYGYIWFPSSVVAGVWVYFFLPEVQGKPDSYQSTNRLLTARYKGRTLEEIDEMVSRRHEYLSLSCI